MCGTVVGLQRNVYLAAFTFLAFLLTLFYAVHYWLKRCVPKVAEAFFIYMDGVENMLVIFFLNISLLIASVNGLAIYHVWSYYYCKKLNKKYFTVL